MFLGYQKGKICYIANTKEELENLPCVVLDEIKETQESYVLQDGEYVKFEVYQDNMNKKQIELRLEERKSLMDSVLWRVQRYEQQSRLGIETDDTYETYTNILLYIQYLRDITENTMYPNVDLLTFDEWSKGR
jgi:hypothetical protein